MLVAVLKFSNAGFDTQMCDILAARTMCVVQVVQLQASL